MIYSNVQAAFNYAEQVVRGEIVACKYIRLACQRHINDLAKVADKNYPYYFDYEHAEKVLTFVQMLPHVKGEWAFKRQLITLSPWQKFALAAPFGWKRKKDDTRRFREVYDEIPRKNGKSILAAAVGLVGFVFDGEYGAEIYSGATTEKQAWEVFRPAQQMVRKTPLLQQAFGIQVNASNMCCLADGARFEPLIGNPGDGASPSVALIDEYHEHDAPDLYETMLTGMGARRQPLIWIITTAGRNIEGPCYDKRQQAIAMLEGSVADDELFALIYTIDEEDDWTSDSALRKANPNLGVSIYEDYLLSQQQKAIKNASAQNTFKTKHLNIWTNARIAYFNMEDWRKCKDESLQIEDFAGMECISSLDIASKLDILANVKCFPRTIDGKRHYYIVGSRFWLPEETVETIEDRGSRSRYQKWMNLGILETFEGAENDLAVVAEEVISDSKTFAITEIPHDPWGAFEIAHTLSKAGLVPVKIDQNVKNLSPAMKELQSAMVSGRIHHDGNPILTWMMSNVVAKEDANENVFPRKEKPANKIDGAVALMMCVLRAMIEPDGGYQSPYKDEVYI